MNQGQDDMMSSWISTGPNAAISADQLTPEGRLPDTDVLENTLGSLLSRIG